MALASARMLKPPSRGAARAAAAGAVIIVSAGNDGDSTDAGIDPNNPDPFAQSLLQAGGNNVIIVDVVGHHPRNSER